jgi:hypothetical protein
VIELLNHYFVPVFTSNEDYQEGGSAPREERAELRRLQLEGYAKKLSVGTVHAFVIGPDGHLFSSLHTAEAAKPPKLIAMLEEAVANFKTPAGSPIVRPSAPAAPVCSADSIRLYITARYLQRKGDDYDLTEDPGGGWAASPGTEWLCVPKNDWSGLLPPSDAARWKLPQSFVERLLTHFYPPTENNDLEKNRFESADLSATVSERKGAITTVKIEGRLRMKHDFYHKEDGKYVDASVVGFAEVDTGSGRVKSFNLVTDRADYREADGKTFLPFGVAVRLAQSH